MNCAAADAGIASIAAKRNTRHMLGFSRSSRRSDHSLRTASNHTTTSVWKPPQYNFSERRNVHRPKPHQCAEEIINSLSHKKRYSAKYTDNTDGKEVS